MPRTRARRSRKRAAQREQVHDIAALKAMESDRCSSRMSSSLGYHSDAQETIVGEEPKKPDWDFAADDLDVGFIDDDMLSATVPANDDTDILFDEIMQWIEATRRNRVLGSSVSEWPLDSSTAVCTTDTSDGEVLACLTDGGRKLERLDITEVINEVKELSPPHTIVDMVEQDWVGERHEDIPSSGLGAWIMSGLFTALGSDEDVSFYNEEDMQKKRKKKKPNKNRNRRRRRAEKARNVGVMEATVDNIRDTLEGLRFIFACILYLLLLGRVDVLNLKKKAGIQHI